MLLFNFLPMLLPCSSWGEILFKKRSEDSLGLLTNRPKSLVVLSVYFMIMDETDIKTKEEIQKPESSYFSTPQNLSVEQPKIYTIAGEKFIINQRVTPYLRFVQSEVEFCITVLVTTLHS